MWCSTKYTGFFNKMMSQRTRLTSRDVACVRLSHWIDPESGLLLHQSFLLMDSVFNLSPFLPTCHLPSHPTAFSLCSWSPTHGNVAPEPVACVLSAVPISPLQMTRLLLFLNGQNAQICIFFLYNTSLYKKNTHTNFQRPWGIDHILK